MHSLDITICKFIDGTPNGLVSLTALTICNGQLVGHPVIQICYKLEWMNEWMNEWMKTFIGRN